VNQFGMSTAVRSELDGCGSAVLDETACVDRYLATTRLLTPMGGSVS
jgi:hypothetical protein